MATRILARAVILALLAAAPVYAAEAQQRRNSGQSRNRSTESRQAPAQRERQNDRATESRQAPAQRERQNDRTTERQAPAQRERQNDQATERREAPRQDNTARQSERQSQARPSEGPRQNQSPRQFETPRQSQQSRGYAVPRRFDPPRPSDRGRYDNRGYNGYNGRRFGSVRIIRPSIIEVVPYRFYNYRPSYRVGVYYGVGGSYPYGDVPRGYYDPIPGRYYGGVRITDMPRDAQVFADGYFIGIVDDFDGIFQHMNLEAGPHHIEIDDGYGDPVAFDVNVRPSQTITFRAGQYRPY